MNQNAPEARILTPDALRRLRRSRPERERFSPLSDTPFVVIETHQPDGETAEWLQNLPCPVIGLGAWPTGSPMHMSAFDVIADAPRTLALMIRTVRHAPIAAMTLVQQLRLSDRLPARDALVAESLAYGTVQRGAAFLQWLAENNSPPPSHDRASPPVDVARAHGALHIRLNRPARRNEIDASMRDALCEALQVAAADRSITSIRITGAGRMFSAGGAVHEFGAIADPAAAHAVRSVQLPATWLQTLAPRLAVHLNGAAIGAGLEMAAFANRLTADQNAWVQLPELKYGLIPGAGGTVSLPRRIGRQRTAYLALTQRRLTAETARQWGLVDSIGPQDET